MSLYDLIWQYKEVVVSVTGLCIVIAWYGLIVDVFYRMFKLIKNEGVFETLLTQPSAEGNLIPLKKENG